MNRKNICRILTRVMLGSVLLIPTTANAEQEKIENKGQDYLNVLDISKEELNDLLKHDGFLESEINYSLSNLSNYNWKQECLDKAKDYINIFGKEHFTRDSLKGQLQFDKFTNDEIEYALNEVYKSNNNSSNNDGNINNNNNNNYDIENNNKSPYSENKRQEQKLQDINENKQKPQESQQIKKSNEAIPKTGDIGLLSIFGLLTTSGAGLIGMKKFKK